VNAQYGHILLFFLIGAIFGSINLFMSSLLRFKSRDTQQKIPYECGMEPVGTPYVPTRVGFYLTALLFVIFDIEALFLFPWAVTFREFGSMGLFNMGVFMGVLTLGLVYVWRMGALRWNA